MPTSASNPREIQDKDKKASGSDKAQHPAHQGGDAVQNASEWGGGSSEETAGAREHERPHDGRTCVQRRRRAGENENSSAKS